MAHVLREGVGYLEDLDAAGVGGDRMKGCYIDLTLEVDLVGACWS